MPMRCTAHSYLRLARRDQRPKGWRPPTGIALASLMSLVSLMSPGLGGLASAEGRLLSPGSASAGSSASASGGSSASASGGSNGSPGGGASPLGGSQRTTANLKLPASLARPLPAAVDRRQVAIIDLVGDEEAGALGRELAAELVRHRELAPLADPAIAAMMIGPIFDEDSAAMESAKRALADAGDALARFELSVAAARAAAGQAELNNVQPTTAAMALYAELAFVLGQAKLSDGDGPAARSSFLLTQRLGPERTPDPARYLPDVIAAFRQARRSGGGRVPVQIRGQGTAYVDGQNVGTAPLTLELAPGAHVVHLFGPTRLARGTRIEVTPSAPSVVVLPDARASLSVIVARGRRAAIAAADPMSLTTSVAQLARLIAVSDVVVLSRGTDGILTAQAWRDRPPGAGMMHPVNAGDAVAASLLDLAPAPLLPVAPPTLVIRREDEPRWYRKRWVQVSVVTGALAVITTALVLSATADEGSVSLNPDTQF